MEVIAISPQGEQDVEVLYRLELDSAPTIGYASIQNSVPVLRTVRLTNNSNEELTEVELLVRCDPAFAIGAKLRFQKLAPGETRSLGPIDLQPDHSFLADLQEGMTASVSLTLVQGDRELAREAKAIEVLAYDQWAGTRALPELLAAFSMPNNPAVDVLIGKASKLLRSSYPELSMNGYQSKSRDIVWKQVSALYSTIAAENLQYSEPPASFGSDGQKIRTPDLLKLRETARRIAALGQALPTLANHPLALIGQTEWSPSWQDDLLVAAEEAASAAATLKQRVEPLAKLLGVAGAGQSLEAFAALDQLAEVLMAAPKVPAGLAKQANDERTRSRVASLISHGKVRQRRWDEVGPGWSPQFAKFRSTELKAEWTQALNAWWPKSWFAKRAVLGKLASVRLDGKPATPEALSRAFEPLADVNDEDEYLHSMQADAESLLQESFAGIDTKWTDVETHNAWAGKYAQAIAALAHPLSQGVEGVQAINARLVPLLGEQRAMLLPGGVVGASVVAYRDALAEFSAKLLRLTELSKPVEPLSGPAGADGALERVRASIERWKQSKGDLRPWCQWRKVRDEAIALGLQGVVQTVEGGAVALSDVPAHFEFSYQNWWLKKTFDADAGSSIAFGRPTGGSPPSASSRSFTSVCDVSCRGETHRLNSCAFSRGPASRRRDLAGSPSDRLGATRATPWPGCTAT